MMRRWWHYLLLGVVALLLFLVMRFPAPVAYSLAAGNLGGQVKLAGISGTLWQGEAQQLQLNKQVVADLNWQLSAWSLLLGELSGEVSLHQDKAYLQSQLTTPLSGGEVVASDIEGRLPLNLIQPYLAQLPLPLEGVLSLKLKTLQLDAAGRPQQAEGRIVWHQAGVSAPQQLLFGDLQMDLESVAGGGIKGTISDSGGPLKLNVILTLSAEGSYQVKGTIKGAESAPPELRQTLTMLGRANAEGAYPLNLSGTL